MVAKEGYAHCMLKEIYEQPKAVMDTLSDWIGDPQRLLDEPGIADRIRNLRRLHIVGCGTSYHAALTGRYLIERFVHIPVLVDIASEYRCMDPVLTKGTLFITLTRSGESEDILAAQRDARKKGAPTFTVCNEEGSTAIREADSVLFTRAGPEGGLTSAKTFTAQLAALCLLGIALGTKKGTLAPVEAQALKSVLLDLPCLINRALRTDAKIREIAQELVHAKGLLYLGRGANYPIALEGALKMKELSHVHAEGFPTGELRPGPLALTEEGFPVIVMAPLDNLHEKVLSDIEEAKTKGARIVAVTDALAALRDRVEEVILIPAAHPLLLPFMNVVPLQLLAYHIAVMKGLRVDRQRDPAKR